MASEVAKIICCAKDEGAKDEGTKVEGADNNR